MKKYLYLCLINNICFGLNTAKIINYNLSKKLTQKSDIESINFIHSPKIRKSLKKIVAQKNKEKLKNYTGINSQNKYLYNKKSKVSTIKIKPDFNSIEAATINYDSVINGLANSEYKLLISEFTYLGITKNSVTINHNY